MVLAASKGSMPGIVPSPVAPVGSSTLKRGAVGSRDSCRAHHTITDVDRGRLARRDSVEGLVQLDFELVSDDLHSPWDCRAVSSDLHEAVAFVRLARPPRLDASQSGHF